MNQTESYSRQLYTLHTKLQRMGQLASSDKALLRAFTELLKPLTQVELKLQALEKRKLEGGALRENDHNSLTEIITSLNHKKNFYIKKIQQHKNNPKIKQFSQEYISIHRHWLRVRQAC